jgi:hypothetical protein
MAEAKWRRYRIMTMIKKLKSLLLGKNKNTNYEDVSKIYNQLRKNYESKLLFNEASNFFIGEMEAIRKSLWNGKGRKKWHLYPISFTRL